MLWNCLSCPSLLFFTIYFVDFEHPAPKTLARSEFTWTVRGLRDNLTRSQS